MSVSIKISDENYRMLCSLSGKLRKEFGRPASINDAITLLSKKGSISELAGSWVMSDDEAREISANLKRGWKSWKTKFA